VCPARPMRTWTRPEPGASTPSYTPRQVPDSQQRTPLARTSNPPGEMNRGDGSEQRRVSRRTPYLPLCTRLTGARSANLAHVTHPLDQRPERRQWLADGTAPWCTWRFGIGRRVVEFGEPFLEVVLETRATDDDRGMGTLGVIGYPLNKLASRGIEWGGMSGPFSQDFDDDRNERFLEGATRKGTRAVEVEMDGGTRRPATVVRCDAAPFDLFVVVLHPQDRPTALLRYEERDFAAERVPLSIRRPSWWPE